MPQATPLSGHLDAKETIWLVAALCRLVKTPFLTVPVLSNEAFDSIPTLAGEPVLEPFEIEPRIFSPADSTGRTIDEDSLTWVRDHWVSCGNLFEKHSKFYDVLKAFDYAALRGRTSAALIALWGGLEQLFSPSPGELRFRVASVLSAYMHPYGPERLSAFKRILALYNERSAAAHTSANSALNPVVETYVLLRNVLVRIIDENCLPSQDSLEALLFGGPV